MKGKTVREGQGGKKDNRRKPCLDLPQPSPPPLPVKAPGLLWAPVLPLPVSTLFSNYKGKKQEGMSQCLQKIFYLQ